MGGTDAEPFRILKFSLSKKNAEMWQSPQTTFHVFMLHV